MRADFVSPLVLMPKNHNEGVVRYCSAVSRCAPMTLCKCCKSCPNHNAFKNKFHSWKQGASRSLGRLCGILENSTLHPRPTHVVRYYPGLRYRPKRGGDRSSAKTSSRGQITATKRTRVPPAVRRHLEVMVPQPKRHWSAGLQPAESGSHLSVLRRRRRTMFV